MSTKKYIYGSGSYGKMLASFLVGKGEGVIAFIDQYSTAESVMGMPVIKMEKADPTVPVYVSVALVPEFGNEIGIIEHQLQLNGFCNVYSFSEVIKQHPGYLENLAQLGVLWMQPGIADLTLQKTDKIKQVRRLLADEMSQYVLDRIVSFRKTFSINDYPWPDHQREYFPEDVPILSKMPYLSFIDGGGYIGDTLESAADVCVEKEIPFSFALSVEPDNANFINLTESVRRVQAKVPEVQIITLLASLWSETTLLNFASGAGSGSCISKESENLVPSYALDELLCGIKPTYLKLDVEGAEEAVLQGAMQLIQKHSPTLAICVYHKPEDLWRLPLLIHSFGIEYEYYLRVHGHMGLSTVLYCVPKSN